MKECRAIFNEYTNRVTKLSNFTIDLELSSNFNHFEIEQLPEPKLQLSQINQFLIEQQPQ